MGDQLDGEEEKGASAGGVVSRDEPDAVAALWQSAPGESEPAAVAVHPSDALSGPERWFFRTCLWGFSLVLLVVLIDISIWLRAGAMWLGGAPGGIAHHPDVLGEMYWLTMPVIPAVFAGSVWVLRKLRRSWLTTVALAGLAACVVVAIPPLLAADPGPHMLAWATLGLHRLAVWVVPLILAAGVWRAVLVLDRVGRRSGFRAGAFSVGSLALSTMLVAMVAMPPEHDDEAVEFLLNAVDRSLTVERVNVGPGRPAALRGLYIGYAYAIDDLHHTVGHVELPGAPLASRWASLDWSTLAATDAANQSFNNCILSLYSEEWSRQRSRARGSQLAPADMEDLVMTAFIKVCELYSQGSVRDPRPYLERTITNAMRDRYRASRRFAECSVEVPWTPRQEPTAMLREVQQAMCSLDDRQRIALEMWLAQSTHQEIATYLGVSPANARQIVHRALVQVRASLQ